MEVIPSQQDGPYAYRTILGWCVVGPIVDEKPDVVSCNWIALLQAENGSIVKHHFEVQNKCEDIGIKEMLRKIYMSDFQDTISEQELSIIGKMLEIANEDRRFLKILDAQTTEVGNQYQTTLPLKNPDVKLPNNRKVAERRLLYLNKRLMKRDKFHKQYTEFMQEILEQGNQNQPHRMEEFGVCLISSNINEVIRPVLNFFIFFTKRFNKQKKTTKHKKCV